MQGSEEACLWIFHRCEVRRLRVGSEHANVEIVGDVSTDDLIVQRRSIARKANAQSVISKQAIASVVKIALYVQFVVALLTP